jgi:hypothetical protein
VVGLFITSLNDVIDLHTKRVTQGRNRIPGSIWASLYVIAILGMAEYDPPGGGDYSPDGCGFGRDAADRRPRSLTRGLS